MSNTIRLKGCSRYEEAVAAGTISPGQLIKHNTSSQVLRHSTATGFGAVYIAIEDALQGKTVDDNYAADDIVGYIIPQSGDECQVKLDAGENVVVGDMLESAGNGNFQKFTSGTRMFEVLEAKDLSSSSAVATLIRARRL